MFATKAVRVRSLKYLHDQAGYPAHLGGEYYEHSRASITGDRRERNL